MKPPIDFLIITPLREELDAVLRKIPASKLPPTDQDVRTYFSAELPTTFAGGDQASYKVIIAPLLGMGRVEAAGVTADAIRKWKPRYVLLIGIAGGYGKADVKLGDVIISDQVVDYELQKVTKSGPTVRWRVHEVDPRLLGASQNILDDSWTARIEAKRPRKGRPQVRRGAICTGDKVIANGLLDDYQEVWDRLIGVEMEAGGVASVAYQSPLRPGFFMVRGVSDLADEKKDARTVKKWREYACDAAASFAAALLAQGPVPLQSARTRQTADQFWNGTPVEQSRVHERAANGDPSVLVVFVPGNDCQQSLKTWSNLPRLILREIGIDADAILYASPVSKRGASDRMATAHLRRLILNRPHAYMHILLVARGQGSALVKELLAGDVEALAKPNTEILDQLPPIATKVRAVFNFPRGVCAGESPNDKPAGSNLDQRLLRSLDILKINDFPRPRRFEFTHPEDAGAAFETASNGGSLDLVEIIPEIENQNSLDNPKRKHAHFATLVERMRPYFSSPELVYSYLIMRRFVGLDAGITPTPEAAELGSRVDRLEDWVGWDGSQQFVLARLNDLSESRQLSEHSRILLTGGAGVGKSIVLRRHARWVATQYLEGHTTAQLCLYIPMQNVSLTSQQLESMPPKGSAQDAWRLLSQYMANLIDDVLMDPREETVFGQPGKPKNLKSWENLRTLLNQSWVEGLTKRSLVKVMLDGVDEFLLNHSSSLSVESITQFLQVFESPVTGHKVQCILGARNTLPAIAELSLRRDDVYEIRHLSEKTAEEWFPGTRDLLSGIQDENLRRLLLTPLVLVRLGPRAHRIKQESLDSRAAILGHALQALIEESQLMTVGKEAASGSRSKPWLQSLVLTAWGLYRDSLGVITVDQLRERIKQLRQLWSNANRLSHCFVDGFRVFENPQAFRALQSRTVLNHLGKESIRFTHREWQDFLVSNYLAECALGQMFSDLNFRAFTKQIYIDAAEVLWHKSVRSGEQIDNAWLDVAFSGNNPFAHPYAVMNICALLGNGPVAVDQAAFRRLMGVICDERCPEITRIVAASSFGMRLLRDDKRDQSIKYMLVEMMEAFTEMIRQGVAPERKVTASLAWCYRAEIKRRRPTLRAPGDGPWPALSANTAAGVEAARASGSLWQQIGDAVIVDDRFRSFQLAVAQYPLAARSLPDEEISLTHYLFLATACLKAGAAASEIFPLLRAVFARDSGVASRLERYPLAEIRELFASCYQAAQDVLFSADAPVTH